MTDVEVVALSEVEGYVRRTKGGKVVQVGSYRNRVVKAAESPRTSEGKLRPATTGTAGRFPGGRKVPGLAATVPEVPEVPEVPPAPEPEPRQARVGREVTEVRDAEEAVRTAGYEVEAPPPREVREAADRLTKAGYRIKAPSRKAQEVEVGPAEQVAAAVDRLEAANPGLKLDVSVSGGFVKVSRIVVPEGARGQGVGTAVMRALLDVADERGLKVALTPTSDFGGTKSRLVKFYRGLGFVPNTGRNRDYGTKETMVRDPVRKPKAGTRVKLSGAQEALIGFACG